MSLKLDLNIYGSMIYFRVSIVDYFEKDGLFNEWCLDN